MSHVYVRQTNSAGYTFNTANSSSSFGTSDWTLATIVVGITFLARGLTLEWFEPFGDSEGGSGIPVSGGTGFHWILG